jgi:glycosyltransferase involved in cell wall biosynthesis
MKRIVSPKISVIIPVYNTAPYLRRCLDSVCSQTLPDIEIICVNDGSTDNSLDILNEYAAKDKRAKVINFPENKGVSAARNAGIDAAQGEYVGFVDSDDAVLPDFYENLYKNAKENAADIVESPMQISSSLNGKSFPLMPPWFCSSLYRSGFLQENNINFPVLCGAGEDIVFCLRTGMSNPVRYKTSDVGYCCIRRPNSLSQNKDKTIVDSRLLAFDICMNELNEKFEKKEIGKTLYLDLYTKMFMLLSSWMQFRSQYLNIYDAVKKLIAYYHHLIQLDKTIDVKPLVLDETVLQLLNDGNIEKLISYFTLGKNRLVSALRMKLHRPMPGRA